VTHLNPEMNSTPEYVRLEGVSPECFDGDHARTRNFLNRLKRFALMNDDAVVVKNTLKRCTYSLTLIDGPNVEGWSERAYRCIRPTRQNSERSNDASPNKTAWDVLEEDFLQSFVDYVERERACGKIKRLSMTDGRIDKYVAAFELLAHRAPSIKLDDPANLRTFARGLPRRLAENTSISKTFTQ